MHCIFVGFLGEVCDVDINRVPNIYSIEGGEVCVVSDREACEEVHINAEYFAVEFNPSFSCRVAVCIGRLMTL